VRGPLRPLRHRLDRTIFATWAASELIIAISVALTDAMRSRMPPDGRP
jgi:hypothetical protein